VDPLHRNTWPIHVGDDDAPVGHLTEHITVALDGPPPPAHVDWSWTLYLTKQRDDGATVTSRKRFPSWREALDNFAQVHYGFTLPREVDLVER
jgi:hypothetical protein